MDAREPWLDRLARDSMTTLNPSERTRYTADVMAKVRAIAAAPQPSRGSLRQWLTWPSAALAFAATAAGVGIVLWFAAPATREIGWMAERDAQVLASVEDLVTEPVATDDSETLADELQLVETMQVADVPLNDEQWIHQTLQLLDQVGDVNPL